MHDIPKPLEIPFNDDEKYTVQIPLSMSFTSTIEQKNFITLASESESDFSSLPTTPLHIHTARISPTKSTLTRSLSDLQFKQAEYQRKLNLNEKLAHSASTPTSKKHTRTWLENHLEYRSPKEIGPLECEEEDSNPDLICMSPFNESSVPSKAVFHNDSVAAFIHSPSFVEDYFDPSSHRRVVQSSSPDDTDETKWIEYTTDNDDGLPSCKFTDSNLNNALRVLKSVSIAAKNRLLDLLSNFHVQTVKELLPIEMRASFSRVLPRFARINSLLTDTNQVQKGLLELNYSLIDFDTLIQKKKQKVFCFDPYVTNLICFSPRDKIVQSHFVEQCHLIIQDKASCLPTLALMPDKTSVVIDACSAPGNKTSMLASLMANEGHIYAVEISPRRAKEMKYKLELCGVHNTTVINESFLDIHPEDYSNVTHILLDPSCSGTGTLNIDKLLSGSTFSQEELDSLVSFQLNALKHAFSFPGVRRVVYSTCSILEAENEAVVASITPFAKEKGFNLVKILPKWTRRGIGNFPGIQRCVRASSDDFTIGFFVACFYRNLPTKRAHDKF